MTGLGLQAYPGWAGAATGAGAATWARAVTPRDRRAGGDTLAAATATEDTPKVGVDTDALTTGRTRGRRVCTVVAARFTAVRDALAEDPAADDDGEDDDAEPSAGALSAAATPAPASAAPTPTLSRPAPNHAYG